MPRDLALRLALCLAPLLSLPAAATAAAPHDALTYRQQANRACQVFFDQTESGPSSALLSKGPWTTKRRREAADLRHGARASLRTDAELDRIEHPARIDADWQRMLLADRRGAAVLLDAADRIERSPNPRAGGRILERSLGSRYERVQDPFNKLARKLGLDGCLGLDPTADLGRDRTASAGDRAAARAFAVAGEQFAAAAKAQRPAIEANLKGVADLPCDGELEHAPERVQQVAGSLFLASYLHASLDPLEPALGSLNADLVTVRTTDRALRAGRQALRRALTELIFAPPAGDPCAALAAWKQAGYRPDAAPKASSRSFPSLFFGKDSELVAFGRRLRALGVGARPIRALIGGVVSAGLDGGPVRG
jgi:hypothetical protein